MGKNNIRQIHPSLTACISLLCVLLSACASMQNPTGGPKDKTPPKILKETPANLTKKFASKTIEIQFDEFFKLSNESKEISISPALDKMPEFKVKKKILEIKFTDSLARNTTYTLNFGKAIVDYNEGNILKNFSYVFSTGDIIDSLSLSGNVINAITRKAEFETTVILIPFGQDSLFTKRRASLFTLTDSAGNFQLNNLKAGTYRLYALKEQGGDRIYNSTKEEIGFLQDSIVLTKNTTGADLITFKEIPELFRSPDHKLLPDGRLFFTFNRPLLSPGIHILSPAELDKTKSVEYNKTKDSLYAWLPDLSFDSLRVAISDNGIPLDTFTVKNNKATKYNLSLSVISNIANTRLKTKDLVLTFSAPLSTTARVDFSKITLLEDSISVPAIVKTDTSSSKNILISYPFKKKKIYAIKLDEGALTGINTGKNKAFTDQFIFDTEDNSAMFHLKIIVPDSIKQTYLVQLLRNEGETIASQKITRSQTVDFAGLSAGTYSVRIVYDGNDNGKWDTGNLKKRVQPERIWNLAKLFDMRASQEDTETITIPKDQ